MFCPVPFPFVLYVCVHRGKNISFHKGCCPARIPAYLGIAAKQRRSTNLPPSAWSLSPTCYWAPQQKVSVQLMRCLAFSVVVLCVFWHRSKTYVFNKFAAYRVSRASCVSRLWGGQREMGVQNMCCRTPFACVLHVCEHRGKKQVFKKLMCIRKHICIHIHVCIYVGAHGCTYVHITDMHIVSMSLLLTHKHIAMPVI